MEITQLIHRGIKAVFHGRGLKVPVVVVVEGEVGPERGVVVAEDVAVVVQNKLALILALHPKGDFKLERDMNF
ncbi:hypothetical protein SUGI_0860600 [Cryptomeria japonica]|nr:hypothetical protein SUGI_0860600 [Cryptomeria japonica]